jgi:hypothetical protein
VYVFFPGTSGDSAFFENNDQILLGRVPAEQILERDAYEFWWGPAAVRKTPLLAMPFICKMHLFAKTGSGQA